MNELKKIEIIIKILVALFVANLAVISFYVVKNRNVPIKQESNEIKIDSSSVLNVKNLRSELKKAGCIEIDLSIRIALYESAHFKSRRATEDNNIFGLRLQPFETTHKAIDSNLFLIYSDWRDCVKDYATWQSYALCKNSGYISDWCGYMQKFYCGCDGYCDEISRVKID